MRAILVVEDDSDMLDTLAETLRTVGFQTHKVRNGAQALIEFRKLDPALVIVDEGLGTVSGSTMLKVLRRMTRGARRPALFVTGSPETVRCQPGDVVLAKPLDVDAFLEAVLKLVPPEALAS